MIKSELIETTVKCADCGLPAIRRQVFAHTPSKGGNYVCYETHSENLADPAHREALERLDRFYTKLHELKAEMRERLQSLAEVQAEEPSDVRIVEVDFASVTPTACQQRTLLIPVMSYRIQGSDSLTKEFDARPIDNTTAENLLAELVETTERLSNRNKLSN